MPGAEVPLDADAARQVARVTLEADERLPQRVALPEHDAFEPVIPDHPAP